MSINRATLDGYCGADPEIRDLPGGGTVATLRLATSETWTDKVTGEKKERTQWHAIVCFSDWINGVIRQKLHKGSRCMVEGQIETRKYTDKTGGERWITEIIVRGGNSRILPIDWPKADRGAPAPTADPRSSHAAQQTGAGAGGLDDDDIPF